MKLLLVRLILVAAAMSATTTVALQTIRAERTHLIKFIGMKHDFDNQTLARQTLAEGLSTLTQRSIVVESLDESGATWYCPEIVDCAEPQIEALLATIRGPGGLKREYKMLLNEMFSPPSRIEIEWLGPCANIGRKRSQVDSTGVGGADDDSSSVAPSITATTLIPDSSATTPEQTTTTATTTTTPEPTPPTTTTEQPTTPPPGITTSQPSIQPTTDSELPATATTTTSSIGITIGYSPFDFDFGTNKSSDSEPTTMLSDVSTTTTESISSTTTNAGPATESLLPTTTESIPPTTAESMPPPTTDSILPTTTTESQPPTTTTDPGTITDSSITPRSLVLSEEPHYGKYIGLSAAFLIFVAYVLCARSYRRQGRYEL